MSARLGVVDERTEQPELPDHPVLRLVGSAVGLAIAFCLIGFAIVDLLTPSAPTR